MSKSNASTSCLFPILGDDNIEIDDDNNQGNTIEETESNEESIKPEKRKHSHHHHSHHERKHKKSNKADEEEKISKNDNYIIDKNGDDSILFYGSNDREKVSNYKIDRRILPLGIEDQPAFVQYKLQNHLPSKNVRYFSSAVINQLKDKNKKRIHYEKSTLRNKRLDKDMIILNSDFLPLPPEIELKDDEEIDSKEEEEEALKLQKQFSEEERKNPKRVELWLEYISKQASPDTYLTGKALNTLVERKISLYQKALEYNPCDLRLIKGLMNIISKYCEEERSEKLWSNILKVKKMKPILWSDYIRYRVNNFSDFNMTKMRLLFENGYNDLLEYYSELEAAINNNNKATIVINSDNNYNNDINSDNIEKLNEIEYSLRRLINMSCEIEKCSGYSSIGLIAYQCIYEYNFNMPNAVKGQTVETKKRFFEVYYEGNNNNIIGFKRDNSGWNKWMEEQENEIGINKDEETKAKSFFKHKRTANQNNNNNNSELSILQQQQQRQLRSDLSTIMKRRNEIMFPWRLDPIITNDEEEKEKEKSDDDKIENDENVEYETFWSTVHRARITRPKVMQTEKIYKKILGEINEIEESKKVEKDKIKYKNIDPNDSYYLLLNKENELDEINWKPNYIDNNIDFKIISPYLIRFNNKMKYELLYDMLEYNGVYITNRYSTNSPIYQDKLLLSDTLKNDILLFDETYSLWEIIQKQLLICNINSNYMMDNGRIEFIRNVIYTVCQNNPTDIPLHCLYMTFESEISLINNNSDNEILYREIGKKILQSNPSSQSDLRLWYYYIANEIRHNQIDEALNLLNRILLTSNQLPSQSKVYSSLLTQLLVSVLLFKGSQKVIPPFIDDFSAVIQVIVLFTEGKYCDYKTAINIDQSRINKAIQWFELKIDRIKSLNDKNKLQFLQDEYFLLPPFACIILLYGYLQYTQNGIEEFINTMNEKIEIFHVDNEFLPYGEWLLYKEYEFLCYYINSSKTISRKIMRKSIYNSLQIYPNNQLLLLLLYKYQENGPLSFTIRYYLMLLLDNCESYLTKLSILITPISMLYCILFHSSILYRQSKYANSKPSPFSIRSLFEKVIEKGGTNIPLIWREYILFEMNNNEYEKAKQVYYRSIYRCPWSKKLWLDVINILRPILEEEEIKETLKIILDKSISLRSIE